MIALLEYLTVLLELYIVPLEVPYSLLVNSTALACVSLSLSLGLTKPICLHINCSYSDVMKCIASHNMHSIAILCSYLIS